MPNSDSNASIESWLKERGYTPEERQKIMAKLAEHDHATMSDAIFDSIGTSDKTLDQMIAAMLRD
jgi:hypothetical protein